jgi:hypothetical protein
MSKCRHFWHKLFAYKPAVDKRTGETYTKKIKIGRYCSKCPAKYIVPEKQHLVQFVRS